MANAQSLWFWFFFQAEDGIRDVAVTGVQTCALPISLSPSKFVTQASGTITAPVRARKTFSMTPVAPPAVRSAVETKAAKRPSPLSEGSILLSTASPPLLVTEMRRVEGVQPGSPPRQVSCTKMSAAALVSPGTKLVAKEKKATKRPSALREGRVVLSLSPWEPSLASETRAVEGVQPTGAPPPGPRTPTSNFSSSLPPP